MRKKPKIPPPQGVMHCARWLVLLRPFLHLHLFLPLLLPLRPHLLSLLIAIWFCVLLVQTVKIRPLIRKDVQSKKNHLFYYWERKPKNVTVIFNHYATTLFDLPYSISNCDRRNWKMIFLSPEACTVEMIGWPSEITQPVKDGKVNLKYLGSNGAHTIKDGFDNGKIYFKKKVEDK